MAKVSMIQRVKRIQHTKRSEAVGIISMIIGLLCLLLALIFWGLSAIIKDFIYSEILGAYSAMSLSLCFSFVFLGLLFAAEKWAGKIASLLAASLLFFASYHFLETSLLLYKDKSAYENKQFERLVDIPVKAEYDDPETGTEYVMELLFKDLTIDVYSLDITRSYYEATLSGKPLDIHYLPNSRYAVSLKIHTD